jgi:cyanate lyase
MPAASVRTVAPSVELAAVFTTAPALELDDAPDDEAAEVAAAFDLEDEPAL